MNKNTVVKFSKTKQSRSENTLNVLLDTADQLVTLANPKNFTARSLSEKSGYALGTLLNRLESVENVFLWAIEKQRDQHIQSIVKIIEAFDLDRPIQALGEALADKTFVTLKEVNPKVIQFIESRLIKRDQFSLQYFHYFDPIALALLKHSKKNTTHTFKKLTAMEAKLILRSFVMIVERPVVEEDPIAGSNQHRKIAIESFVRLFGD